MPISAWIGDAHHRARRNLPKLFFDYVKHGYSGSTLKRNRSDLERISIRQRVMVDVSSRDTSTTLLGEAIAAPIVLAPVGSFGLQ